jgi:hypothetical protein
VIAMVELEHTLGMDVAPLLHDRVE